MSILILMRHGQSIWNLQNRFTGGIDVPLTRKGIKQAKRSGQELKKTGISGIFAASLELTREGIISIMQKKSFDKLLIKEKK